MRNSLLLAASIALTILSWGIYGPVLRFGQIGMSEATHPALLRPFVCVGIAYFLIAVIVPVLWLHFRGEKGEWTTLGIIWSVAGGAVGAIGALGVVLAFKFGGTPDYIMPLVFGGAPVVNAFLTIYLAGRLHEIGPWFLAGLIMVVLGAVTVLIFAPKPAAAAPAATPTAAAASATTGSAAKASASDSAPAGDKTIASAAATAPEAPATAGFWNWVWGWMLRLGALALTIICWGAYGPVLHKGQVAMHHSRMRSLVCVGMAYFLIAVIVPDMILADFPEASTYGHFFSGTLLSLLGGSVGALGALGIVFAFTYGGRPVFVMPLVFGGAPVINTLFVMFMAWRKGANLEFGPIFFAGLILVVAGAAIVLVMAPARGCFSARSQRRRWRRERQGRVQWPAARGQERETRRQTAPRMRSGCRMDSVVRRIARRGAGADRIVRPAIVTAPLIVQRLVADVFPAPGTAKADAFHCAVGGQLGGRNAGTQRRDAQHAATIGDDLAVAKGRAGVEDFDVGEFFGFVQAADRVASLILAGIAFAGHHDAHRRARVPLGWLHFIEEAVDGGFEQLDKIALEPQE